MVSKKTTALYDKALKWIKKRQFSDLKALTENYEAPKSFYRRRDETVITPDITAVRAGKKSFFDIVLKDGAKSKLASKWQLMQTLAEQKGGKLYLFAPYGHKAFAERLVERFGLNAKVVKLA